MPATLSIISNVFTEPAERGRAIAVWAGFSAMGIAIGPLSGGWLLEHFWWGSVFMVNIPIVILALTGGRLFVPESKDPSPRGLDPVGALLSIVGLGGPGVGHHRGAGPGLDRPHDAERLPRRRRVHRRLHRLGAAHRPPHARRALLRQPPLQRRQHGGDPGVLRPVRVDVPPDPVPAVRAGLQRPRGRPAGAARWPSCSWSPRPLSARLVERVGDQVHRGRRPGHRVAVARGPVLRHGRRPATRWCWPAS